MVYQGNDTFSDDERPFVPRYYLDSAQSPSDIPPVIQSDLWRFHDLKSYLNENPNVSFSDEQLTLIRNLVPYFDEGVFMPRDLPYGEQLKTFKQWEREGYIFDEGIPLRFHELPLTHPKYRPLDFHSCPTCGRPY